MKIFTLAFLFILSNLSFADTGCRWENREHQPFETRGHTWGGGDFSTFEECQRLVRVTIMAFEPYWKDFQGELAFIDPTTNEKKLCFLGRVAYPFHPSPEGYDLLVYEAYHGRSSVEEFFQYKSFIDSNFTPYCE